MWHSVLLIGWARLQERLTNLPIDDYRIVVGTIWSAYMRLVHRRPCCRYIPPSCVELRLHILRNSAIDSLPISYESNLEINMRYTSFRVKLIVLIFISNNLDWHYSMDSGGKWETHFIVHRAIWWELGFPLVKVSEKKVKKNMLKILASLIKPRKSQITQSTALQRKRTNEVMYDLLEKWNYYYRKR